MNLQPVPALPPEPAAVARPAADVPRREIDTTRAAATPEPAGLRDVVERAAAEMFSGQLVEVDSFYDEQAARMVYRVADKFTGEVLIETPPEELLRFYATSRGGSEIAGPSRPLLAVEA